MTTDAVPLIAVGTSAAADHPPIDWAVRSWCGSRRAENEDRYLADGGVFAVCDGVGGGPDGALAAEITIAALGGAARSREVQPLATVLADANHRVLSRRSPARPGESMATTATAIRLHDGAVEFAHVGDSRAYLFSTGNLSRVTRDHTVVAELVDSGVIPPERASSHPLRGVILRAVGLAPELQADCLWLPSHPDDVILLASDGLTDRLSDEVIAEVLGSGIDLEGLVEALASRARDAGSGDDITVLVVTCPQGHSRARPPASAVPARGPHPSLDAAEA